jgi:hypothetical protein
MNGMDRIVPGSGGMLPSPTPILSILFILSTGPYPPGATQGDPFTAW